MAHVILMSALGPNSSIFLFWRTFIQLGDLLGHGLGPGLGPGLDNFPCTSKRKMLKIKKSTGGHPDIMSRNILTSCY